MQKANRTFREMSESGILVGLFVCGIENFVGNAEAFDGPVI